MFSAAGASICRDCARLALEVLACRAIDQIALKLQAGNVPFLAPTVGQRKDATVALPSSRDNSSTEAKRWAGRRQADADECQDAQRARGWEHRRLVRRLWRLAHELSEKQWGAMLFHTGVGCDRPHSLAETEREFGLTRSDVQRLIKRGSELCDVRAVVCIAAPQAPAVAAEDCAMDDAGLARDDVSTVALEMRRRPTMEVPAP